MGLDLSACSLDKANNYYAELSSGKLVLRSVLRSLRLPLLVKLPMLLRPSTSTRASGSHYSVTSSFATLSRSRSNSCSYTALGSYSRRQPLVKPILPHHSPIGATSRTVQLERISPQPSQLRFTSSASSAQREPRDSSHLRASFALPAAAGVVCILFTALLLLPQKQPVSEATAEEAVLILDDPSEDMSAQLPGRPGNLTPEQEEKLRQLWQMIFQVCAVWPTENGSGAASAADPAAEKADSVKGEKTKKKRSLFSRSKGKKDSDAESGAAVTVGGSVVQLKEGDEDKYGQVKHFHETLANQAPESIRDTIWSMLKHDHPDALVLRFLRARKWDVEKALVMLISTMNWRAQEMHVDDDIMKLGEGGAAELEKGTDATARVSRDFLAQIRMGKSFLHGVDKNGRPICVVRVRLHRQGDQVEESLERYTVYIIETCRMLLQPPVDTAVSARVFRLGSYSVN